MRRANTRYQTVDRDVGEVVVSRGRIARRVRGLARQVSACYAGKELTVLAAMTGSVVFLADLIRHLPLRMRLDLAWVSSYRGRTTRPRAPRLDRAGIPARLTGRHVLILDDILDSGRTLRALLRAVRARRPASLRTCVLLRKSRKGLPDRPAADFVGFEIGDRFVVGYGLDFDGLYRNLRDVRVLRGRRKGRRP